MNTSFIKDCDKIVLDVQHILQDNPEWIKRFEEYADKILSKTGQIKKNRSKFHEWAPLYLYMNLTKAKEIKEKVYFSLRYRGQNVAELSVKKSDVQLSTKPFLQTNKDYFDFSEECHKYPWRSLQGKLFREFFSGQPERNPKMRLKNNEHRLESLLLTEFSKKKSEGKKLLNIQPVLIAGKARFQMATPISANKKNKIDHSENGGGIDILSRTGRGRGVKLCIMEVKDETNTNEPPSKVISQALAYATFIHSLLRSDFGSKWWRVFQFTGELPKKLNINVACVMPSSGANDYSFKNEVVNINENDCFVLHYVYFTETNEQINRIESSLK